MSFATQRAADAAFIRRTGGEFVATIQIWTSAQDPGEDTPTYEVNCTRFTESGDRQEGRSDQSERRKCIAIVNKADASSIDPNGWISVGGEIYKIQSADDTDDVTWTIAATRKLTRAMGDPSGFLGG